MNIDLKSKNSKLIENASKLIALDSEDERIEFNATIMQLNFLDEANKMLKKKGLNRNDLADALGVTKSFISQLFSGDKKLNLEMIAKLQAFFQTPVSLTFQNRKKSKDKEVKTSNKKTIKTPPVRNKLMKAS